MGDVALCVASPPICLAKKGGDRLADNGSNGIAGKIAEQVTDLVNGMLDRALDSLLYFITLWLDTPSASLDESDPVGAAIGELQSYLTAITVFFAVMGLIVAAVRMAWMARVEPIKEIAAMFMRVMFVQAAALMVTQLLLQAGDEFAPWLVETATDGSMNHSIVTLMPFIQGSAGAYLVNPQFVVTQGVGAMLIVGIIILIVTALQVLFLLLRDVLLAIILGFLPTLAAASLFRGGAEGFEKALGWIVALVVYKPVAAAIYALGVLMITNVAGDKSDPGQAWMGILLGTLTLVLAVFAMPALVKFVAPAAGRGVSSAFSGAAGVGAVAGVAATGAAVVAVAGTGGAAAPAAAGASGGAGAGGAGAGAVGGGAGAAGAASGSAGSGSGMVPPAGETASGAGSGVTGAASGAGSGQSAPGGGPSAGGSEPSEGSQTSGGSGETGAGGGEGSRPAPGDGTPSGAGGAPSSGGSGGSASQALQQVGDRASEDGQDTGAAVEDMTK